MYDSSDEVFWLFRISFMYYALIGVIVCFVVAYPVSILTGGMREFDEILLTPFCRSKQYKIRMSKKDVHYEELDRTIVELKKIDD